MEYRRYCPKDTEGAEYCPQTERWYIPEVMDGVSVQKAINKIMAEVRKGQSSDGRNKGHYPDYPQMVIRLKRDPMADAAAEYAKVFCQNMRHVPAKYTNGVTA
jgi:hypothetical protein